MATNFLLAAQSAEAQSEGNPLLGFVVICLFIWGIWSVFASKSKGYDIDVTRRTTGRITPR